MFPIILDLSRFNVVLVGGGDASYRRLKQLDECGVKNITVFADNFGKSFWRLAGDRLLTRLPNQADLKGNHIVMIADIEDEIAFQIAELAREEGVLVNIEDRKNYCDFYFPSLLKRGDLLIAISTCGKSPTVARRIRQYLEVLFPPVWKDRLSRVAQFRDKWKDEGKTYKEISDNTDFLIDNSGWFLDVTKPEEEEEREIA